MYQNVHKFWSYGVRGQGVIYIKQEVFELKM